MVLTVIQELRLICHGFDSDSGAKLICHGFDSDSGAKVDLSWF